MTKVIRFAFKLFVYLFIALLIHIFILKKLDHSIFSNYIIQAYSANYFLALSIYFFIYKFKEVLKYQIGFIFIGGSFLKFIMFFLFFNPLYEIDDHISRFEFAAFFIPYVICLTVETLSIIEILNNLEASDKEAKNKLKK